MTVRALELGAHKAPGLKRHAGLAGDSGAMSSSVGCTYFQCPWWDVACAMRAAARERR